MAKQNNFSAVLYRLEAKLLTVCNRTQEVRYLHDSGNMAEAYAAALRLEEQAEKLVLLTRSLPAFTGNPRANDDVKKIVSESMNIQIGFTPHGWFQLRFPALLPKKGAGSVDYIRASLYPAMREFFKRSPPVRYGKSVLIYRHIYDRSRPERRKRDHDNIEVNMVTDIVAMYVLPDDGPEVCSQFYCSEEGDEDTTEVYVVPEEKFPVWLKERRRMAKK